MSLSPAFAASSHFVFFGTYTRKPPSQGIYVARFDAGTGALSQTTLAAVASNPTFLALHPTLPVLYAVAGASGARGGSARGAGVSGDKAGGIVSAYAIDTATGALALIGEVADGATNGTYVALTPDGRTLLTAHYTGGYLNAFPVGADGRLGGAVSTVRHSMTGAHPQQAAPHPHCIDVSPDGRFAFVADLAADRIFSYRIEKDSRLADGKIAAALAPGSGVRHLAFSPDARRLYAINELAASVTAYDYDARDGALREIETVPTVPADFPGRRWGAEVAVRPDGKFLYASNRASHESIAVFAIDAADGPLAPVQHATGLAHPRHFAIAPGGRWLICANQDADNAAIFRIDAATGKLSEAGARAPVPSPVCVVFVPATGAAR